MTDTTGKPILDNESNSLSKGRLKLVTKLLMDNKYELMDDLNYSRTTTQNNSIENYFINDVYMNQNGLGNSNKLSLNGLSGTQPASLSSLPVTSSSYLSLLPFMTQQEEDKTSLNNNNNRSSGYNNSEMNKLFDSNILDTIPSQLLTNKFKNIDNFNFNKPLFIPKSTRLKAERVRIYLHYFYNVLERCISLDNNSTTQHYHNPNSPVKNISYVHRHHYHEGVEGVYNPLQVIRNRKLRKKYHSELKPLRELTFTKVPLIAVVQFSNKPNRKLKWFVELSEKYSDLTWRTSHWNELRRPDGRRWSENPKYNNLFNGSTDTSFNDSSNYEGIHGHKHLKSCGDEVDSNYNSSSNTSFNYESNNNEIPSRSSYKKRSKIKKKTKRLGDIDDNHSLNRKDKETKNQDLYDNEINHSDLLLNNTRKHSSNSVSYQKNFSSSTSSVNIINELDPYNNAPTMEKFKHHKDKDNFSSAINKMEKILSKTKPKNLHKSPKKLHKETNTPSDLTSEAIKPNIITTPPTFIINSDCDSTHLTNNNINDDGGYSSSSNYLKLPNKKDKIIYNSSPNSNESKYLSSNSKEDESSISLTSLSSYSSHISLKLHKNQKNTDSNSTNKDKSDKSSDISHNSTNCPSNLVPTINTSSSNPSTPLSSDSSSDSSLSSSDSSLILNVNSNNRRNQRRKPMAPIALHEDDDMSLNKPTSPLINSNKLNSNSILKTTKANFQNINYDRRNFINNPNTFIDDQLDPDNSSSLENSTEENQNSSNSVIIDEQLLQYWQDTRYILSTIAIMKHRRKTHDIVKKRAIQKRNETVKFEKDADYHISKTKEIINKYSSELDKAIVVGNKWTSRLLNDYSIRVETLISSSDRILSDINTTLTLKLKLFQENTERFDNFKIVYSQRSTRLVYKLLELFIIGILWTIWLLVITAKKIKFAIILTLKIVKWMVW